MGGDSQEGELQIKGPAVFQGYVCVCLCEKGTLCACTCVQVTAICDHLSFEGAPTSSLPSPLCRYWGRSEETAEAFTADGWFKTGDVAGELCRVACILCMSCDCHMLQSAYRSGRYYILGRASADIIKCGGFKLRSV